MMTQLISREKIFKEIKQVPDDKLAELYDFIHYFRIGLEVSQKKENPIINYAGCWKKMPQETFDDFTKEAVQRRQQAFSRRRDCEASSD